MKTILRYLRRGWIGWRGAALLGLLASCATNPVTRQSQLMLISQEQELQIGKESSKEIQKEYGYYEDPALNGYVRQVGGKLVAVCQRRDIPYHFQVVDSPVINAFALPGGYIYVTRGILARMNSEDELAAVLGHELTHVAARHGASELSKAAVAQAGLVAVAIFNPELAQGVGQYAGAALNLAFLGYSRDLEAQADEYGISYLEKAGYNPRGAVKMFLMFQSIEKDSPSRMERFLMSHPPTAERLAYAQKRLMQADSKDPELADEPLRRDPFLRRVDGLLLGQARGEKLLVDGVFYDRANRVSLALPVTYSAILQPQDPDAQAMFVRQARAGAGSGAVQYVAAIEVHPQGRAAGPSDFADRYLSALKIGHRTVEAKDVTTAQGRPMALRVVDLTAKDGTARAVMGFATNAGKGLVVYGFTDPAAFDEARPELAAILKSLRFLSASEASAVQPVHIHLTTARDGETWGAIAAKELGDRALAPAFAAYNGTFHPQKQPKAGTLIKVPDRHALEGQ